MKVITGVGCWSSAVPARARRVAVLPAVGKWEAMREAVTIDNTLALAQTSIYDILPEFLAAHREYATRTGVAVPHETPQQEERFQDIRKRVQALRAPGVPAGLELPQPASAK